MQLTKNNKKQSVRIVIEGKLEEYIKEKKEEYPLFDTSEIVKMLLSEGLNSRYNNGFQKMFNILEKQELQEKLITSLSEKEQEQLLIDNDLM